jgi:phosphoribosylamine--glycine ligase
MPRLQTDLVALFAAMDNGTLADANISFSEKSFATVVTVSGGYPNNYEKNKLITLSPPLEGFGEAYIFHAGTKINDEGNLVTNGGRVLTVTSSGENISEAVAKSKEILRQISFEGMYFRKDIGWEF